MYVFFEHHKALNGDVVATDVICSSYKNNTRINWKVDKTQFEIMRGLLKAPRLEQRSHDDSLKMWTYLGTAGFKMLAVLEETFRKIPTARIEFLEVEGLETAARQGFISDEKTKVFDTKNFFYNTAPITVEITVEQAKKKLSELFNVTDKKSYRQAALALHPDRNGGDGSKMSELNMYWRIYGEKV